MESTDREREGGLESACGDATGNETTAAKWTCKTDSVRLTRDGCLVEEAATEASLVLLAECCWGDSDVCERKDKHEQQQQSLQDTASKRQPA